MDTTASEREVRTLPQLDAAAITAAAAAWVDARIKDLTDSEDLARVAAKIATREFATTEDVRVERDAAAYTVATTYRLRRGANMPGALGVNRNRWKVIRDKQKELAESGQWRGPIDNALEVLPKLAAKAALHNARSEAARKVMYAATRQLSALGWTNAAIGELIGRDASRVSHIKHMEGDAA